MIPLLTYLWYIYHFDNKGIKVKNYILSVFAIVCSLNCFASEKIGQFYPTVMGKEMPSGSLGQDKDGIFLCFGVLQENGKSESKMQMHSCQGKKISAKQYVQEHLNAKYKGSKYAYQNEKFGAFIYWEKI